MMTELNPLMRPLLDAGFAPFTAVKLSGLLGLWLAVAMYFRRNPAFCRKACALGSLAYAAIWIAWTTIGNV